MLPVFQSECSCGCHTNPGVMHIVACCRPDPDMSKWVPGARIEYVNRAGHFAGAIQEMHSRTGYIIVKLDDDDARMHVVSINRCQLDWRQTK